MSGGITRKNGTLIAPKNFAGVALKDFTLTFTNTATTGAALALDLVTPGGALDQVFRTATGNVGSVSRVGTLDTSTNTLRFAVEVLGDDSFSAGKLGMGPTNSGSIAAALQAAIVAIGDVTVPGTTSTVVHLTSATVVAFAY